MIRKLKQFDQDYTIMTEMTLAYNLIESRGLSKIVFNAMLNDIKVDTNYSTEYHYLNLLNTYGKDLWREYFKMIYPNIA